MAHHREACAAFGTAKLRNAAAVADTDRTGKSYFNRRLTS